MKKSHTNDGVGEIRTSPGENHMCLHMELEHSEDGTITVRMTDHTSRMIVKFPCEVTGTAAMPAADHLFEVD